MRGIVYRWRQRLSSDCSVPQTGMITTAAPASACGNRRQVLCQRHSPLSSHGHDLHLCHQGYDYNCRCAGINQHEGGDGRAPAEGLATHGDPESCAGFCEGRGEALTGARAGRAVGPRNAGTRGPTPSAERKATPLAALSRAAWGPRAVEIHGMCGTLCARTGRSRACPSAWSAGGPPGERCGGNPRMHGCGKSDQFVVPASLPNKARAEEAREKELSSGEHGRRKLRTQCRARRVKSAGPCARGRAEG